MNRKRKTTYRIVIYAAAVTAFLGVILAILNSISPQTYSSAKKECEGILLKRQYEMQEVAAKALGTGKDVSGDFFDYYYSCYQDEGFVKFDIGSQGMLGGQYWELVYTKDGVFMMEKKSFSFKKMTETT